VVCFKQSHTTMSTHRSAVGCALLCMVLLTLVAVPEALAQKDSPDIPTVSNATAWTDIRIVQAPGRVIESGTLVIRNGVIEAVGRRADIPWDARVVDGSGLTVYAGLIDVLSYAGVPEPESIQAPQPVPDRSNPSFERAGITPDQSVRSDLDPSDKSVTDMRKMGFTAALTSPRGRMLPGSASIVLMKGSDGADMVVPGIQPMVFQFRGASGVYPGTPMAIMSKFRQLYREADRRMQVAAMYESDPSGLTMPPFDAVHDAFRPVIDQDESVIMFTDEVLEVHRALTLQKDLGFDLVLAGLNGGFDALNEVSAAGVPVVLTMDVPDNPQWAAKLKADSLDQILASYTEETRTATFRDVEAEKRNLEARQLMARAKYVGMASQFAEAGLPIAFSSYGVDIKDLGSNFREMMEAGLSEDDLLAGLTVNAASILQTSDMMGTVEAGKMANVVLTDGPLFAEDTEVQMVVVGGHVFDYRKAKGEKEDDSDDDDSGDSSFEIEDNNTSEVNQ